MRFLFFCFIVLPACIPKKPLDTRLIVSKKIVEDKYLLPKFFLLPDKVSPFWHEMQKNLQIKDYEKIEQDIRRFLQKNPNNSHAITVLMKILFLQRKYELADYYANLLIKTDSKHSDAKMITNLVVLSKANSYEYERSQALRALVSLFTEDKTHIASGLNLAIFLMQRGNYTQAMSYFIKVSQRCSACGIALIGYAICLVRLDRMQEANDILLTVSKRSKDVLARYYLAFTYINLGENIEKGLKILKGILKNDTLDGNIRNKSRLLLLHTKNSVITQDNNSKPASTQR